VQRGATQECKLALSQCPDGFLASALRQSCVVCQFRRHGVEAGAGVVFNDIQGQAMKPRAVSG
jgi:hypothetical protein